MLRNNIKLAWRSIRKNKLFSFISLTGLSIGLLACIAVISVVIDDFSYDTGWSKKNDIYRLLTKVDMGDGLYDTRSYSWAGLKPALKDNFPEVEAVSSINRSEYHVKKLLEEQNEVSFHAIRSDTLVWNLFDFKVISGNPKKLVHGQTNLVLTKSLKNELFPEEDVINKIVYSVSSFGDEPSEFLITGVIDDIPNNTHLRADALVIRKGRVETLAKQEYGTFNQNYVLLKSGTDSKIFAEKLSTWYSDFVGGETRYSYKFQPLVDIYLNSEFDSSLDIKGNKSTNYMLLGVAILLLLIGCVNFINLSVAKSLSRVKEIGVRKIIGSSRTQIVLQFLVESILYYIIAILVALSAFYLIKPSIETFIGHNLQISLIDSLRYIGLVFFFVFLLSIITGIYPALLISGFKSINSLKGQILKNQINGQQIVQKGLIVVQFSIALFVLVSVFVVSKQLDHINSKDLGYNKDNLVAINPVSWNGKGLSFQKELQNIPNVQSSSLVSWRPTFGSGGMSKSIVNPNNPDTKLDVFFISGDAYLPETLGLELTEGRFFDPNRSIDVPKAKTSFSLDDKDEGPNSQSSLVTEYTSEVLGINSLNELITEVETVPIGRVKNFYTKSLREDLVPVVITANSNPQYSSMLIRLKEGSKSQALSEISATWRRMFPNKYLGLNWVDELVDQQYAEEKRLQTFFTYFSVLSLLLAAMGVFGLVAQSTRRRIKEIGVRKVLGASIASIAIMFSKDYAKLVLSAIVIAMPLAYYASSDWLQNFAYRTSIHWTILLIPPVLVLSITLFTVVIQSTRAANSNPIKSLKTE